MTAWSRADHLFHEGLNEVSEALREPLLRQALMLLRAEDVPMHVEQADDLRRLLDSQDARNSAPYLDIATRVHDRFKALR